MSVVIETTIGDITVDLYLKERPNTCLNFLKLCKVKYYNLCVFYKVERNFIAQVGDPTCTGRGGESVFCRLYGEQAKYFDAEMKPRLKHEKLGTISMVNNGNNMNGSQFFITLGENLTYLDEVHTVFGEVAEGFDILLKLNEAICDPNNRPYQDIRITHTVVLHDPYEDPGGLDIPDSSPIPTREQLESNYIGADEEIDDTKGKTAEEIEEKIKESEAKARATILEMIGDIPDADVKPPENVLFVCKLNPVTTSEDLEIIFSRFGPIISCEVIKDKKTDESLQYAFIEFEKEEDCENAYFKMDNVLIDDRRIHVDFSQSVAKLNYDAQKNLLKGKFGKSQNFVIKSKGKKSDGYEMVFDIDHNSPNARRNDKHRERSPNRSLNEYQMPSSGHSHKKSDNKFRSVEQKKYKGREKYLDDRSYPSDKSKHSSNTSGITKDRQVSTKRISKNKSSSPSSKKKKRHDSSDQSDSSNYDHVPNKEIYRKKYRHDSSSSASESPKSIINKHQKLKGASNSTHQFISGKTVMPRQRHHDSYMRSRSTSPEPAYVKESGSIGTFDTRSLEISRSKRKSSKPASHHREKSRSPEPSKHIIKSRKDISSRNTPYSKSSERHKTSHDKSKRRSRSNTPEFQKRKELTRKTSSYSRHYSKSPVGSNIKTATFKENQSYTRSPSRSPESSHHVRKCTKYSSHSRSRSNTPESSKQNKRTSKHCSSPAISSISFRYKSKQSYSKSSSRSPESSNKKKASKHHSSSRNQNISSKHEKSKAKFRSSKNLTEYSENSSSEGDRQPSEHKLSTKYSYSKKHSHKEYKRSRSES